MRRRYLVCYDVSDKMRLRRVHKTMKGYGEPLQYSVFSCDLNDVEKTLMLEAVLPKMNQQDDRLMVVDLGSPHRRGPKAAEVFGPEPRLPSDGAIVI